MRGEVPDVAPPECAIAAVAARPRSGRRACLVQATWLEDGWRLWQSIPHVIYVTEGYQKIVEPGGKMWLYPVE